MRSKCFIKIFRDTNNGKNYSELSDKHPSFPAFLFPVRDVKISISEPLVKFVRLPGMSSMNTAVCAVLSVSLDAQCL